MMAANVTFYERVEDALEDNQLHEALAFATGRFVDGRVRLMSALPEAELLRDHARRIRAHTLANLDHYLAQFAEMVERQGGQIHWAATAEEATRTVVNLAQARGVKTVVKSKSMVSEELEINEALQNIGVRAVETDLGEFIVQLAGEKPSHIIAPAIHKSRRDVARLFQKKLKATEAEVADVPQMYALARRTLRQDFLQAGMGISGANFGVAETGSICLVTNEGNGRLTTTLPPIHVVLMGIERLLPTTEDLGVLLQILARSATGQKMSVYTTILAGPRREGEDSGPAELHVVLVDNGRTKILGSELAEILYCIRCGACLNACPVYREIGGHAYGSVYPGPVGSVVTPGLYGVVPWSELPHASSLCGACREACPVRIDIPRMLLKLRDEGIRANKAPLWLKYGIKFYRLAVLHPTLFHLGGWLGSWATGLMGKDGWVKKLPGPLSAWTDSRDFPALAPKSFSQRWREERKG
jgi:L-lactate dehydrogenase complex protein LldF